MEQIDFSLDLFLIDDLYLLIFCFGLMCVLMFLCSYIQNFRTSKVQSRWKNNAVIFWDTLEAWNNSKLNKLVTAEIVDNTPTLMYFYIV